MKPIIQVENLSKLYRLGVIGATTLRDSLERWWYRMRRKEEMYKKVGAKHLMIEPGDPQAGPEPNTLWALKDVSFSVQKGEIVGIIGKNGAGKSTLLKILTRITEPTKGRAIMRGRVSSLLEVGTGFHQELTGRENIYLNGAILGMRKAEIDKKFDEIVAFAEIEKFIDTPVKRYSSGMYVRLAFAVAAHLEPEILLVDEVLAVGDAAFQKKCLGKMGDVAKEGRTVLFVSHNMAAIQSLCPRTIWLADGQIKANGLTSEIVMNYLESIPRAKTIEQIPTLIKQLPHDPHFRLIDVKITQNGSPLSQQALSGKPIEVEIDYEVKKRTSNFRIFLDILDNEETLLIHNFHDCDSPEATIAEPGKYTSKVIIPDDFLAPKEYILRIGATIFGKCSLVGPDLGVRFNLSVLRTGRLNRGYSLDVEIGKFSPLFTWETKRIS